MGFMWRRIKASRDIDVLSGSIKCGEIPDYLSDC
jgi:hypothetical protein